MLPLQDLTHIQGNDRTSGPIWNYVAGTLTSWDANRIALSNSSAWKCAPMQVIKQPEHGRTSTTEEQK